MAGGNRKRSYRLLASGEKTIGSARKVTQPAMWINSCLILSPVKTGVMYYKYNVIGPQNPLLKPTTALPLPIHYRLFAEGETNRFMLILIFVT